LPVALQPNLIEAASISDGDCFNINVVMYKSADYFDIPTLSILAMKKFEASAIQLWSLATKSSESSFGNDQFYEEGDAIGKFMAAVGLAYCSTLADKYHIRNTIVTAGKIYLSTDFTRKISDFHTRHNTGIWYRPSHQDMRSEQAGQPV
jgi:hypothetical protein